MWKTRVPSRFISCLYGYWRAIYSLSKFLPQQSLRNAPDWRHFGRVKQCLRALLLSCVAILCSLAALREWRAWRSDWIAREGTPEALRAALNCTPDDAAKWRNLGILLLRKGGDSKAPFQRAIELNAYESDAQLGLAIEAESHGMEKAAESFYKRAVELNGCFRPKYALAAFYTRAGRQSDFWRIASAAVSIDQADIASIVHLASDAGADLDEIPALLHLETESALASYLQIAFAQNRPKPLAEVALRLPASLQHRAALLDACERLIEDGATAPAIAVWNRLGIFVKLDPGAGCSLTNTEFAYSPVRGFNWRASAIAGVRIGPEAAGLRIELTGEQPEHALVLEQIVPVLARSKYRFAVRSESPELSAEAGLTWQIERALSHDILAATPVSKTSTSFDFHTPAGCNLIHAMLMYDRKIGTVRIATTLDLRSARLELLR